MRSQLVQFRRLCETYIAYLENAVANSGLLASQPHRKDCQLATARERPSHCVRASAIPQNANVDEPPPLLCLRCQTGCFRTRIDIECPVNGGRVVVQWSIDLQYELHARLARFTGSLLDFQRECRIQPGLHSKHWRFSARSGQGN